MSINKRILYGLSALLILGYSLISPFNSASALDGKDKYPSFHTTKRLYLENGPNSQMDFTYYDVLLFFNRDEMYNRKIKWSCNNFTRQEAYTSYKKALYNNSGWLITQYERNYTYQINSSRDAIYNSKSINLYWSETKPDEGTVAYYAGSSSKNRHDFYSFGFPSNVRGNTRRLTANYDFRSETIYIGCEPNAANYLTRISADNPDVADYWIEKGEFEKTSVFLLAYPYKLDKRSITWDLPFIPDSVQQDLYPHFSYDLKYLKLKVYHLKKEDHIEFPKAWDSYDNKKGYYIPDKTDYTVEFAVQNRKGGDVVQNGLQYIKSGGDFTVDLPSLGEYSVSAQYRVKVCYAYSYDRDKTIVPADGDYCFYAPPDETKSVKYGMRTAYIKADGESKSGSTLTMNCIEGFCSDLPQKPKYEDCSQYDWTFGAIKIPSPGSIACAIRNTFIWFFTDFLFGIIFPKIEDIKDIWDDLLDTIIDRLGFLALPFTFIKGVFTTVQAMTTSNPTCAVPLTIFGSTANLEMCRWRYQLPAMWAFMQTILQGGIAIGFLWVCYRLANRFFGIYVEDYEEEDDDAYMSARWVDERTGETGDWQKFRRRD